MNFLFKTCLQNNLAKNVAQNQFRNYARWAHRRPLKVIPPEQYEQTENIQGEDESFKEEIKIKWRQNIIKAKEELNVDEMDQTHRAQQKTKPKRNYIKPKITPKQTDMLETIIDVDGNFVYTKMKNNDPRVGILLTTIKSNKEKLKKDLILLEGKRLIQDALLAGGKLKYLIFTRKDDIEFLKPNLPRIGAQLYKMPYREMQMWSDLTTTPGVMGVFRLPETENYVPKQSIPLTIICDNIREPGNLGAILRASAAVGCKNVILTKGCVNLWDTKVTRSSAGSLFRVQIHQKKDLNELKNSFQANTKIFIADSNVVNSSEDITKNSELLNLVSSLPSIPYHNVTFNKTDEIVLIIGGETNGISVDSYKLAREFNGIRLNIPMDNGIESLNTGTAFGVISFEIRRQLLTSKHETDVN